MKAPLFCKHSRLLTRDCDDCDAERDDRLRAEGREQAERVARRAMACLRHCGCDICRGELQAMDDALRGIPSPLFPEKVPA